jgi:endo-1,4-beta-xylanase
VKGKNRDQLLAILREHLHTVINRYKNRGLVLAWSVVNEPCKRGFFQNAVGDDWIEKVLQYAHEADPKTPLLLNEYGIERGPAGDPVKWERFYGMVRGFKARGIPIHAVGFQGYFELGSKLSDVSDAMRRFQEIGIKVHMTEVAVRVHARSPSPEVLSAQAAKYREILKTCLAARNCELMTIFGITDKLHWLVKSGQAEAPVIFDGNYDPKPAYRSLLAELQSRRRDPSSSSNR